MAGNATPQFTKNGKVSSVLITAANTSSQGTGTIATDTFLVVTADATNGSWIETVRLIATATAPTTTTATVARIFLSTVASGAITSATAFLLAEVTLPATAADNASTSVPPIDVPIQFRLPPGMTILATNHAAPAANTAWRALAIGGDY